MWTGRGGEGFEGKLRNMDVRVGGRFVFLILLREIRQDLGSGTPGKGTPSGTQVVDQLWE